MKSRQLKWQKEKQKQGLCIICGKNPIAKKSKSRCVLCLAKLRQRAEMRKLVELSNRGGE